MSASLLAQAATVTPTVINTLIQAGRSKVKGTPKDRYNRRPALLVADAKIIHRWFKRILAEGSPRHIRRAYRSLTSIQYGPKKFNPTGRRSTAN